MAATVASPIAAKALESNPHMEKAGWSGLDKSYSRRLFCIIRVLVGLG
ncbi:MAG TPA: hypothetical protein VK325_07915 [Pseudoxanthomonas sp.]|nr:hypothetical protein [Pseudoxanthomonas sp.]